MGFETIRLDLATDTFGPKESPGAVATITLDRPEVRNEQRGAHSESGPWCVVFAMNVPR